MAALLDTNFLLAVASIRDDNHGRARAAMRNMTGQRIVAAPILPELFYMLTNRVNYPTAVRVFQSLQSKGFQIEALTASDMARMHSIMTQYQDNEFDFVDVSIMALAERLNIAEVYTFDRRDFLVFRPLHRLYLRLLP